MPWRTRALADASDAGVVQHGKQVYMAHCASCHGRYLQGQPLWELVDVNAGRRAPAHDVSGHTWQHADAELLKITKYGGPFAKGSKQPSAMPGFANVLSDADMLATIAFIKDRWPLAIRVVQAMRNPGHAGMPLDANYSDWRFPPDCRPAGELRRKPPRSR